MRKNPTLLDTIFILLASATLFLFLIWIVTALAGQQATFNDVPEWLKGAAAKIWTKVTLLGGSALTYLLRKFCDESPTPNYLLWIPGGVVFHLLISFGIWFLVHMIVPAPAPPVPALVHIPVRFSLDKSRDPSLAGYDVPDIWFWTEKPSVLDPPVGLKRGNDPLYPFSYNSIDFDHKQYSTAYIKFIQGNSHIGSPGPDYTMCLKLNPNQPKNAGPIVTVLHCENGTCSPAQPNDPGYVVASSECTEKRAAIASGLIPIAFAAEDQQLEQSNGWIVPSLDTLSKMTDRQRVGYTKFQVRFTLNPSLASVDQYYFLLRVNGTPVYVDGLLPERTHYKLLQQGAANEIAFALENLNFSGQYSGYEKLQLTIFLLEKGKLVSRQVVERDYAALRPAPEVSTSNDAGTFTWTGDYIAPKNENKYEILLASADCGNPPKKACVDRAINAKSQFDRNRLEFDGKQVVMVVRPPLRNPPAYGLALGVVQPTEQIQFTFNQSEASELCHWAVDQVGRGQGGKLIQPNLRRYEVANRGYSPCQ